MLRLGTALTRSAVTCRCQSFSTSLHLSEDKGDAFTIGGVSVHIPQGRSKPKQTADSDDTFDTSVLQQVINSNSSNSRTKRPRGGAGDRGPRKNASTEAQAQAQSQARTGAQSNNSKRNKLSRMSPTEFTALNTPASASPQTSRTNASSKRTPRASRPSGNKQASGASYKVSTLKMGESKTSVSDVARGKYGNAFPPNIFTDIHGNVTPNFYGAPEHVDRLAPEPVLSSHCLPLTKPATSMLQVDPEADDLSATAMQLAQLLSSKNASFTASEQKFDKFDNQIKQLLGS